MDGWQKTEKKKKKKERIEPLPKQEDRKDV